MSDVTQPSTVASGHLALSDDQRDQIRERLLGLLDIEAHRLERAELDGAEQPIDPAALIEATEDIRAAIVKLDAGYYGVCETCEGPIPYERLDAIPTVRSCVTCAQQPRSLFG